MNSDNSFEYKTRYGDIERVEVTLDIYAHYDNLYLGMDYYDAELGGKVPYTDITVNAIKMPYLYSAIDTNNNGEEIMTFLEENGFGEDTGRVVSSGWCVYPIFHFNEETLQRMAPYEFREYQKAHGIERKKERPLADLAQEAKGRSVEKNAGRAETRMNSEVER